MKRYSIFLTIFVLSKVCRTDKTSANFVGDYYRDRNIEQIVVFECWDPNDEVEFARYLMQMYARLSFVRIIDNLEMKKMLSVNYYRIGVVLDIDCHRGEIVFENFSENRLSFNESYHWLVLTEATTLPIKILEKMPLTVESEMTFASRGQDSYVLHDVYNPSYRHNGRLNVTFKGVWTPNEGLDDKLTQYKYVRRGNFHGLALNFSIVINNPALPDFETYITTPINRQFDTMIRYHYALALRLKETYNFTMNLQRAKTWGYLVNGTWNGILADMIAGTVDVSVAPFRHKEERMDICDFTVETYTVRPCFIFRHPRINDVRNPFLKPFVVEVWYFVLFVGTVCWLLLYLTARVEKHFRKESPAYTLDTHPASETGLIAMAAITQQGLSDGPRVISGRIVFISLFLWGLLLYQFYSASVVGSLLAEPPRFINTPKDLMNSNIDAYFEDIGYFYDYFRTIKDPDVLAFYDKKIKPTKKRPKGSFTDAANGLRMVKKGGYAFHVDTATAYKIIEDTFTDNEICELQEIEIMKPLKVMMVTSKKSPFTKMIIYGLRRIVEHGLAHALRQVWLARRPTCPESHSSTPVPVQVEEFSPAIFLLLAGSGFAIFVMILEILHRRTNFFQTPVVHEQTDTRIWSSNAESPSDDTMHFEK